MRLRKDIDPLPIPPGDLGPDCFPRGLLLTPGDQRIPKRRPSDGKADKSRHTSCGGEPGMDVSLVPPTAENDAAYVVASISASGLGHMHAIFPPIQSLDLPDIWLDARLL